MASRRELWRVHPGVFVDQSGPLPWQSPPRQRLEPAVIPVAAVARTPDSAIAAAADAVPSGWMYDRDVDYLGLGTTVELDGRLGRGVA